MGNSKPRTEFLIPIERADNTVGTLASRITGVRLVTEIDEIVHALPNKTAWLRRVITEAAQRELMKDGKS
jgi:hypothetical protein